MAIRTKQTIAKISLSIFMPIIVLCILEGVLRAAGIGYPTDFLQKKTVNDQQYWVNNSFYGYRFFDPQIARNPAPIKIKHPKDPNALRVMVLGESAAMGDPVIEFSMARALSKFLNAPGKDERFEVVNASMTAINSHVIVDIAEEISQREADILVIYMGNNEVVGPYGPGTVITSGNWGVRLTPLRVWLTRLRIATVLRSAARSLVKVNKKSQGWSGMEMFAENNIPADSPTLKPMYEQFERNLNQIINAGQKSGARIILCTMAVNLTDCAPLGSRHGKTLDEEKQNQWDYFFSSGIAAQTDDRLIDAEGAFSRALEIDASYAELVFRQAQVLEKSGKRSEAMEMFARARDCDTQRFRTDSVLNAIIRNVAEQKSVTLLDVEQAFTEAGPDRELFLDHVHFSLNGLYVLSREVAKSIGAFYDTPALIDQDDLMKRMFVTPWGKRKQLSVMLQRRERPPFSSQSGNKEWLSNARNRSRELTDVITAAELDKVKNDYERLRLDYPNDVEYAAQWGQILAVADEWEDASAVLTNAVNQLHGYSDIHGLTALALCKSGQPEAAANLLLSTGKPYGYYLQDAALLLISTLDTSGQNSEAAAFAKHLLAEVGMFPRREVIADWLKRQ